MLSFRDGNNIEMINEKLGIREKTVLKGLKK